MFGNMPELKIGHLRAKLPIIQGGMGVGISLSSLASAVANEGGIGIIAAVGIGMNGGAIEGDFHEANAEALRQEIRTARSKTDGLIGVNVMIALTDADRLIEVSVEEDVDVVIMGAGLPLKLPRFIIEKGFDNIRTRFIPIVSSSRAAELIFSHWGKKYSHIPDAVIVEGPLAGGHLGFKSAELFQAANTLENLIADVISAMKPFERQFQRPIPVIAAGGIYTGEDIYKFLQLGAAGVQMATRFVTTGECDADIRFKEMYLDCQESDLRIIESPVGLPGRAIDNEFLQSVVEGEKKPFKCPWKCLRTCNFEKVPYCIAKALILARRGKFYYGFAFAGANAWRAEKIISVHELMDAIKNEFRHESRIMRPDKTQSRPCLAFDHA
ncbi:MAG TPA: nitronate monooxygenase [Candidatus Marinimicrobia bacterium]|mgnify:CR=1 FL=1|nr:nitronate monooxygenase [Candidatus Neomarinimicrobiota bacterium]